MKDSTGHGYPNILRTNKYPVKFVWLVLLLCSVTFCGYLLFKGISDYMENEVTSKIRLVNKSPLTFPMMTVCNSKPFMTRFAYDYTIDHFLKLNNSNNLYTNDAEMKSVLYGNFTNPSSINKFKLVSRNELYLFQNQLADPEFNQSILQALGYTLNEFFLLGAYGEGLLSNDYLIPHYDSYYGNCFKINSGKMPNGSSIPLLTQTESGQANGFLFINFIDTFVNQSYNFMNLLNSYSFGLKISIDDQDAVPLLFKNMIPLKPGTCTYLGLRKTVSSGLPSPYSSCTDLSSFRSVLYDKFVKYGKTYEQRICYEMCKQKKMIDACNCAVIDYPNLDKFRTCNVMNEINCTRNLKPDTSGCDEYCPLECQSVSFDYSTGLEYFPNSANYELFKANALVRARFAYANITNYTYEGLANSLACVYVYFEDMKVTTIEEAATITVVWFYKIMSLISYSYFKLLINFRWIYLHTLAERWASAQVCRS